MNDQEFREVLGKCIQVLDKIDDLKRNRACLSDKIKRMMAPAYITNIDEFYESLEQVKELEREFAGVDETIRHWDAVLDSIKATIQDTLPSGVWYKYQTYGIKHNHAGVTIVAWENIKDAD